MSSQSSRCLRDWIVAMLDASPTPSQVTFTGMPLRSTGPRRIFFGTT